jgi:hypothetical protein
VNVTVSARDQASQQLGIVTDAITKGDVAAVMGRAVQQALRKWFFKLNTERPNMLGGKRTNFYAQAGRSVQAPRNVSGGVVVSITNVGIAQRRFGGKIVAQSSKWLTIPATAEAHGKRAREFSDLHFELIGGKYPALVRSIEKKAGVVYFWLKKAVFQKADPSVLPPEGDLAAAATKAGLSYIARIGQRRVAT